MSPTKTDHPTNGSHKKHMLWMHAAAIICITVWGISFVSTKVLLNHGLGAVEIYIYRFVIAYFAVLAISHKQILSHSWRDEFLFVLLGLSGGSLYFIAENTALEHTLVTNVSLLTSISPLLTALLAGLLYRNERPGRGMYLGSAIAFLGVACVIFNSSATEVKFNPIGDFLSIGAAFCWAVYSLILRRLAANYDVWYISRKSFFYGVITALPFLFFSPKLNNPSILISDWEVLVNMLFLALGASLAAYLLWGVAVKGLGAIKASNYMYFQAVVTMIFSAITLGEKITFIGVLGCALVIGGLYLGDKLAMRANMRKGK